MIVLLDVLRLLFWSQKKNGTIMFELLPLIMMTFPSNIISLLEPLGSQGEMIRRPSVRRPSVHNFTDLLL